MKKWQVGKADTVSSMQISRLENISPLSADVLVSRGYKTKEYADKFFGYDNDLDDMLMYDPFLISDMQKAVDIINDAIDNEEKICIYGDYDCDGIMATSALYNYLYGIGADVFYFINNREDGYGINAENLKKVCYMGADLIITVDNGISAVNEADLALSLDVRMIITDHHTPPDVLPQADAVVNPHIVVDDNDNLFRDLCGCGVVLKLIAAMEGGDNKIAVEIMSEFAAIATIGDVMPLVGENRTIIKHGIHYLKNTENLGLNALLKKLAEKRAFSYTSQNIAYSLVPKINAVGRISNAMRAVELFTTEDDYEAEDIADEILKLNDKRREIDNDISDKVIASLNDTPQKSTFPVIVAAGEGWNCGVIGISAAKVLENTGKPTYIISLKDGVGTGSARAEGEYSIFDSLNNCSDLLSKFGGHKGAGGFTIPEKNIPEFERRLCEFAKGYFFEPVVKAVKIIQPQELTVDIIEKMYLELEPFGEKNEEPVFLIQNAVITRISPMTEGKYTRVNIDYNGLNIAFPMFDTAFNDFPYEVDDKINIMAVPAINEYNGRKSVTFSSVKDIRLSGYSQEKLLNAQKCYNNFISGSCIDSKIVSIMIPKREEFAEIYRDIPDGISRTADYYFYKYSHRINLCKLNIILDVFKEMGLIDYDKGSKLVTKKNITSKVSLENAPTMKKLVSMMNK